MAILKVSSKGQITLPVSARREACIKPGDRVHVETLDGRIVIQAIPDFFELGGFLGPAKPPDEEKDACARAAVERGNVRK